MSQHAKMTEEMLSRARSRIGKTWVPSEPFFNTEVTVDAIRHFVDGIGDVNPLFRDEVYAQNTRYGGLVAPPCFLYSVYWPRGYGANMPGIHGWHSGNEWEWFKPLRKGDKITYSVTLTDIQEKKSRMAGRTFISYDVTEFRNQNKELLSKVKGWTVWAERGAAGKGGKHKEISKHEYSPEELKKIHVDYDKEIIRADAPRYWEDVHEGEDLPFVIKGPLSLRDIITFLMGAGSPYMRAHRRFIDYQKRHPAIGMVDSKTNIVDIPELVHFEKTRASEIGVPGAYDYGPQRICWLGHLVTNWAGDDGFIKRLNGEIRLFNMVGDTTWLKGQVVKRYTEGADYVVDVNCYAENQRGEKTLIGSSSIALPSKNHDIWPIESR